MAFERKPPSRGGKPPVRKPSGKFGGKPSSGFSRGRDDGDRKPRSFSPDRPKRDFGDRAPRSRDGDFERKPKRDFSDRPKRDFGDRPKRDFGDRPARSRDGDFERKPKRDFGDRPPRREYSSDRPKRDFGDRPPRRDFDGDAPRKPREYSSDRPKRDFSDRPKRDFGDRPPRREYSSDRPKRDFGDKPKRDFGDRPQRSFDDRPKREYKKRDDDFAARKPRGEDGASVPMHGHELLFYGVHAVQAALKNAHRTITKIWATDRGLEHLEGHHDTDRHPEVEMVDKRDMERKLPEGAVHQGIAMAVEPLQDVFISDVLAAANAPGAERHVVVILDEVTDPHNVGAVMRSMSVFGARAMIVHKRNAPAVNGTIAKISTGAVEHVPMIPVVNLGGAIQELKNAGFFCLGLDEHADYPLSGAPKEGHIALVLGAEGEGLREKTRSLCDAIANIPTLGQIKSLNVSNAAAIALYAVTHGAD